MKKVVLLILLIAASVTVGYSQTLTPAQFRKQSSAPQAEIIDVRTPQEYDSGHIRKAMNLNVDDSLFLSRIDLLDRKTPYFLYCGIGKRSARAARLMREKGFTSVYELEGGLDNWKRKHLPVEISLREDRDTLSAPSHK